MNTPEESTEDMFFTVQYHSADVYGFDILRSTSIAGTSNYDTRTCHSLTGARNVNELARQIVIQRDVMCKGFPLEYLNMPTSKARKKGAIPLEPRENDELVALLNTLVVEDGQIVER